MTREMSRNQTRDVEPADESLGEIIRPREGTGEVLGRLWFRSILDPPR